MRPTSFSSHGLTTILGIAIAVGTCIGCAPTRPSTTALTAAEIDPPVAAASETPSSKEATPVSTSERESPREGQVICRTSSPSEGTAELVLKWENGSAKGSLEHVAPSGNVTSQRVQAERYKGMIIADHIGAMDLTSHAAIVTEKDGKKYMRVGNDGQPWLPCE